MKLKGIYPALVTPFYENESINYEALEKLTNKLIKEGVQGLFLTGTTGEVFLLSENERKGIVECVSNVKNSVDSKVEIIVQISSTDLKSTLSMGEHAKQSGADAIAVLPPIYFRYQAFEIINFYKSVAQTIDIPVIIYDIPSCTGYEMLDNDLSEVLKIPNVVGMKCSQSRFNLIDYYIRRYPEYSFLLGMDECLLAGLSIGMSGGIGSTYNLIAPTYLELIASYKNNDNERALKLQRKCNFLTDIMVKYNCTASIKYLLSNQGIAAGSCRKPFTELNNEAKTALDKAYFEFMNMEAN